MWHLAIIMCAMSGSPCVESDDSLGPYATLEKCQARRTELVVTDTLPLQLIQIFLHLQSGYNGPVKWIASCQKAT